MARVPFGVTSSPFLLAATIKCHLTKHEKQYPEACHMLENSLYVDDLIGGSDTDESAFQLSSEMKEILNDAGMNLRKWETNSKELANKWKNEGIMTKSGTDAAAKNAVSLKVLGLNWNPDSDAFNFDGRALLEFLVEKRDTKRGILQAAGRIYDPIGFLSPYTIRVKIMFQQLWENHVNWDETLPSDLAKLWEEWCLELPSLRNISIARCYWQGAEDQMFHNVQLHCFSDASLKAYGAVLFLRFCTDKGKVHTAFVASKARVAPLKKTKLTLPRLELLGAVIGVKLTMKIRVLIEQKYPVTCFYWTDSMIALHWVKGSSSQWKPFVQNRVKEVQEKSDPNSWFHCPGPQNPADVLTRGCKLESLRNNHQWWQGPEWLINNQCDWPNNNTRTCEMDTIECEKRKPSIATVQSSCILEANSAPVFDIKNHSALLKVLRITAWIMRFVSNARDPENKSSGPLTAQEIQEAEYYWIIETQFEHFGTEIHNIKENGTVKTTSKIYEFKPFLDDKGLMRIRGRLQMSNFSFDQKHPFIIPDHGHFTELLIQRHHKRMGHAGVAETLYQIREKYWIVRGRQRVKRILNKCIICKKFAAKPLTQETAPLPAERITEAPPFAVTGVDFAGPLYVREGKGRTSKAYITLFTCAVTRAIHLELVSNMTTEMFLLGFRRFVARRGLCKLVISDNALTFKSADKELKSLWKKIKTEDLQEYFGNIGVTWRNITELAPWWGGFYERLVREVKMCLKKVMGKASLSYQEMETTLVEVEAILNSRPLSFTYSEIGEPAPLTPGHFLVGNRLTCLPPTSTREPVCASTKEDMTRRYNYRQKLINQFWQSWRKNYILDLRSAHKQKSLKTSEIKENHAVLVCENLKPRQLWRTGIVVKTYAGRDGKVRSCDVRLSNRKIIKRPVQLLCPLELEM